MTYVDGFIALSNLSRELLNRRETCHVLLNFLIKVDLAKKMDSRYFCTVNPKEGVMSKRFSEQFKQEAVQLVSAERPIRQVASYLGIGYSTLDKWVRAHRERTGQLVALTQEQKRIRELERQVAHLQEVNDILKKATVYFANPANR